MSPPYRFSFETDMQYVDRVGLGAAYLFLNPEPALDANSQSISSDYSLFQTQVAQQPLTTTAGDRGLATILPWWFILLMAAALLVVSYRSYRRSLIRRLRRSGSTLDHQPDSPRVTRTVL